MIISAIALLWLLLAAGFVTVHMDTFKFVPAALLFIPAFGLLILSVDRPKPGPETVKFIILCGLHFLLTVFPSIFWQYGYDEALLTGVNILCYAVCLFIIFSPEPLSLIRRTLYLCTAVLAVVSVFGILEYFGLALLELNRHTGVIAVFFNNPNLYSGALLVLLPASYITCSLLPDGNLRRICIAVSALGFVNLLMAQSRAALIGHFVSLGILALLIPAIYAVPRKRRIMLWTALFGTFALACALFLLLNTQFRDKVIRTFTMENSRLSAWRTALDIWTRDGRTILFGNGLGSFKPLFFTFKPPGYRLGPHMEWWDAAHNEYLELLVDGGLLSLGTFLVMITLTLRAGLRTLRRNEASRRVKLLLLCPLSVVPALLADGFFSTNLRTSYILILFYLALSTTPAIIDSSVLPDDKRRSDRPGLWKAVSLVVFCLILVFCPTFIRRFSSERLLLKGHLAGNPTKKEQYFQRARSADPDNVVAASTIARFYLETGNIAAFRDEVDRTESIIENFTNIDYLRGFASLAEGNPVEASRHLEEYLVLDGGDPEAEEALLYAYILAGNRDAAIAQWDRLLTLFHRLPESSVPEITPGRGEGIFTEGEAIRIGSDKALEILYAAAGRPPVPLPVFLFRINYITGDILQQVDDPEGAAFFLNRALTAAARDRSAIADKGLQSEAVRFLGKYYAEMVNKAAGRPEKIKGLSGLLRLTDQTDLRRALAGLYRRQGAFKKAALVLRGM